MFISDYCGRWEVMEILGFSFFKSLILLCYNFVEDLFYKYGIDRNVFENI